MMMREFLFLFLSNLITSVFNLQQQQQYTWKVKQVLISIQVFSYLNFGFDIFYKNKRKRVKIEIIVNSIRRKIFQISIA